MYGLALIEMTHVAEQEHLRQAETARTRAQARRERRLLGPGRAASAWAAFWAPRDYVLVAPGASGERKATGLTPCTEC